MKIKFIATYRFALQTGASSKDSILQLEGGLVEAQVSSNSEAALRAPKL